MPGLSCPSGFRSSIRPSTVRVFSSTTLPTWKIRPLNFRPGYAPTRMTASHPVRTRARSFSKIWMSTQTVERSAILKRSTPNSTKSPAFTKLSMMFPVIGARTESMDLRVPVFSISASSSGVASRSRSRFLAESNKDCAVLCSVCSAPSLFDCSSAWSSSAWRERKSLL